MSPTKTIDYVKSNFRVVKREKNPLLNYFEVYKLSILISFVGLQNEKSDIQQKQTRLQHVSHVLFWSHSFTTAAIFHYTCIRALAGMRLR